MNSSWRRVASHCLIRRINKIVIATSTPMRGRVNCGMTTSRMGMAVVRLKMMPKLSIQLHSIGSTESFLRAFLSSFIIRNKSVAAAMVRILPITIQLRSVCARIKPEIGGKRSEPIAYVVPQAAMYMPSCLLLDADFESIEYAITLAGIWPSPKISKPSISRLLSVLMAITNPPTAKRLRAVVSVRLGPSVSVIAPADGAINIPAAAGAKRSKPACSIVSCI